MSRGLTCELRLQGTRWASADKKQLAAAFTYLDFCLEQVVKDNELGALRQALQARPASFCCYARVQMRADGPLHGRCEPSLH